MEQRLSQQQLIQMAQQEENVLAEKKAMLAQMYEIMKDSRSAIDSLKEIQAGAGKVLLRLGGGVLVEAEIKNNKTCKKSISEDGYAETDIPYALNWLEERLKTLEGNANRVREDAIKSEGRIEEIVTVLKQIENAKKSMMSDMNKNISTK